MNLTPISREAFARDLGLLVVDGAVAARGIAGLLRQPLCRWGLSPRRAVTRFVRSQLRVAGLSERVPSGEIRRVLDRLQALGECQEVFVGHERYIAPGVPRWVPSGQSCGVLLSVGPVPAGVALLDATSHDDVARRVRAACDDDLAALHVGGVHRCTLEEWIRPLGYLRHASRRLRRSIRTDSVPLTAFWELLVNQLREDGQNHGDESEVRIVTGAPGSFFGRHDAQECEGRWSREADNGVWCAYRSGYGDKHWHPILVEVRGGRRRTLDLYDADEWLWALLARGRAMKDDERRNHNEASVTFTFPLPRQINAAMDLLGPRTGAWCWSVSEGAPDLWSLLQ